MNFEPNIWSSTLFIGARPDGVELRCGGINVNVKTGSVGDSKDLLKTKYRMFPAW